MITEIERTETHTIFKSKASGLPAAYWVVPKGQTFEEHKGAPFFFLSQARIAAQPTTQKG